MANNKTTEVRNDEVKELIVDARFVLRSFQAEDKTEHEFLAFELIDAFKDEDFRNIALKAKWDKFDPKTGKLVRPDRVFGYMSYYAKKALKTSPEVRVKVTLKPVTYKNKKTSKMFTYVGMFADPTFIELKDEKPVEVVVKGANDRNTFELLAGKALGVKYTSNDDEADDYDVGL